MDRITARRVSVLGATGAPLIAAGVVPGALLLPASAPAQKAPAGAPPATTQPGTTPPAGAPPAPAALPEGYVGAETCRACHQEQFEKFSHTKMGRLFLRQPRNSQEALACENCHGPGGEHVAKGGGKGVGGMISFARKDKTPRQKDNQIAPPCHTKGSHMFWRGSAHEARDVACTGCPQVMEDISPRHQAPGATDPRTLGPLH